MATVRRYRWHLFALIFLGLLAIAALQAPRPITGQGVLYPHLWCVGIKFDDGSAYPVSFWPDGWHAQDNGGVVVDREGVVVLRDGDRVQIQGKLTHADGDTPCSYTEILTIEEVEVLVPIPEPSGGDSGG